MLTVGMAYFLFLYIDIRVHVQKAKAAVKEKQRRIQAYNEKIAAVTKIIFKGRTEKHSCNIYDNFCKL